MRVAARHIIARPAPPQDSAELFVAAASGLLGQGRSRGADVTVTQVRRILRGKLVLVLQTGQPVPGIGRHPRVVGGLEIDPVQASGVGAEDQLLGRAIGATKSRKAILPREVTTVDFFPKLSSVAVTEVNGKTMKARKSSKRKAGKRR